MEQEKEQVTVKAVEDNTPPPTPQEKEAAVLEKAVADGEVDEKYSPKEVDGVIKIDLDKLKPKEDNAIQERKTKEVPVGERTGDSKEVDEEVREQSSEENKTVHTEEKVLETPKEESNDSPLELITEETEKANKALKEKKSIEKDTPKKIVQEETKQNLPENVDKLVKFMEETGGTLEDYVNLNKDISKYDNTTLMREYYKSTKPHLNQDDIEFMLNKNFGYDAETDDPSDVKAKQLAFKEELFNAQKHFNTSKEKYYADLKLSQQKDIAPEYKEAYEYYNNQKQVKEEADKLQKDFLNKTDKVFSDDFKGFDFSVGKNKYRFKVDNPLKVKEFQSDIANFANKFISEDGNVNDAQGYHKALFSGVNADKLANHFYEQGRADAIRESAKQAKNIDMSPRADNSSVVNSNGQKIRVVSGNDSSKLRVKWNK
jgi:hypothetical protein|tara:strand:- start:6437 stop:7726 length:1290 start_codon:yes stop_codon:yes gene_type:complete